MGSNNSNIYKRTVTYDIPANSFTQPPQNRFVFYYSQFIKDVNNALKQLWTSAIVDSNYDSSIPVGLRVANYAPYFRLADGGGGYIELILPNLSPAVLSPFRLTNPTGINILMNNKLFYFFSGFPAKYSPDGVTPTNASLTYSLQLNSVDNFQQITSVTTLPTGILYGNVQKQDYPTLFLWQTLSRIFITTTIQIEKEVLLTKNDEGKTEKLETLTDFEIPQTQQGLREYIYFYPQGELRWSNFKSSGWLDRFDMKIFFQTKDLKVYPIYIPPTFEASIKLEFKRRLSSDLLQYTPDSANLQYF